MLSVILIWLYMLLTLMVLGAGINSLSSYLVGYRTKSILCLLYMGLVAATLYAEFFSLFAGVGRVAVIILCQICILITIFLRKQIKEQIDDIVAAIKGHKIATVVAGIIFVLMAYGSSHGLIHYDTGLYHAQSIRWIEEFGVVPGLGNLHTRLAYNSAAFPLTALFGFSFAGLGSFHVTAGFVALLLSWECMRIKNILAEKKLGATFFACCMAIYYLLMIFDEMISPASDYYLVCLVYIIFIRLFALAESEDGEPQAYAMLALFAGYVLTIKLSGALLILIALLPLAMFIRAKEYKKIGVCVISEVIIIAPYLIRNIILSGWLLYPSTAFNWFNVDWKIPEAIAQSDYIEIQAYGRGYVNAADYYRPISEWLVNWFRMQSILDRLFIVAAIVGVAVFVIKCIYYGFSVRRGNRNKQKEQLLFVTGILCVCFGFWILTSPLMRYGCVYVYLTAGVIWGRLLSEITKARTAILIVYGFLSIVGIYKAIMFGREVALAYRTDTFIVQQDYDNFQVFPYKIGNEIFYAPVEGDRVGYDAFPSSPWEMDNITLRGADLRDGFRAAEND